MMEIFFIIITFSCAFFVVLFDQSEIRFDACRDDSDGTRHCYVIINEDVLYSDAAGQCPHHTQVAEVNSNDETAFLQALASNGKFLMLSI